MKCTSLLSLAFATLVAVAPAMAQSAAPADQAASAMPPASMDCGKSTMKRHDHGAERNTGATAKPMAMPCSSAGGASAPEKTGTKRPAHDHAKFHKNQ